MAKYYGNVGYATTIEIEPGVWVEDIIERPYYGDIIRNIRNLQNSSSVNNDINISNEISIIADPFATQNFHTIRYIEFMNVNWKVSNVEVQYPRLILSVGGVYNGPVPKSGTP